MNETLPAGAEITSTDPSSGSGLDAFMTIPVSEYPGLSCDFVIDNDNCVLFVVAVSVNGVLTSRSSLDVFAYADPITGIDASALKAALTNAFDVAGNTATLAADFNIPRFTLNMAIPYSLRAVLI